MTRTLDELWAEYEYLRGRGRILGSVKHATLELVARRAIEQAVRDETAQKYREAFEKMSQAYTLALTLTSRTPLEVSLRITQLVDEANALMREATK